MIIKKFKKNPRIFALTLFILSICPVLAVKAQDNYWVEVPNGQKVPANAVIGGTENGQPLYVCRALYNNSYHPGKVVSGECNIGWGGKEIRIPRFQVLNGKVFWDKKTRGTENAIIAGSENNQPLYLCRAQLTVNNLNLGTHPGKVVQGRCSFGYGGVEKLVADFELGYNSNPLPMPVASQTYRIVSVRSDKVLDVRGPSPENGTVIQQWGDAGVDNQLWQFDSAGDGYYYIRSVYSRKCLDVRGAALNDGAIIQQWDCVGVDNQKWKLVNFENSFIFISKSSGKVLDLENASLENGVNILQWERHNGENQRWRIEKATPSLSHEQRCYNLVQGKIAWNKAGNKTWVEANLRNLCQGTTNPDATIECFKSEIYKTDNWEQAIAVCRSGAITTAMILGTYRRNPVENGYHIGTITQNGSMLRWTNSAGVGWNLIPDLLNRRLFTGEDNPYYKDGHREFKLIVSNGRITGIEFMGEKYYRQ